MYQIEGTITPNTNAQLDEPQRKNCFIIATNQLDCQLLTNEELLATYKDQQHVERGFRFLKDPLFMVSTLFLKSPKSIMALMMVITLCLLVYAALEYRIRQTLRQHNATFPNQKGKAITNPTARWVFQAFTGIHLIVVDGINELILNIKECHRSILQLLGDNYFRIYVNDG